ncbi:3-dehydroquinate synthase [Inquilinus limosus]|uniref:3-dehydroquinate synthase n=1 Tax=Inquilinus limosus TaxID=171674 RepID=A0A211Z076_9PROT|nr:3-dehydroquinate synthase [Inquilinus limosus]OWJ58643.1 3-dehydroquinate synthase [Inquilinus limosus]
MTRETIRVGLGPRSYDIVIGPGALAEAGARITALGRGKRVIVVADARVAGLHGAALEASLAAAGITAETLTVPPGEATKSMAVLADLLDRILALGVERRTLLVALGGGVVGDLAGFAAATALRGLDFVQIPTTLLAQVDSSVGGKTGVNSKHGKNLIGAFHQPLLVLADTALLATLPARELRAGYAEVAKYGALGDADFFAWLEEHGPTLLAGDGDAMIRAVKRSCEMKAEIVGQDEREAAQRALLNLGHTFGHALEAETGYGDALLHGEAVAIGMVMAFDLSVRLGLCPAADRDRLARHLEAVGLPTRPARDRAWSVGALLHHMTRDKKVKDGRMTFILVRGIGQAFVTSEVPAEPVAAVLADAIAA